MSTASYHGGNPKILYSAADRGRIHSLFKVQTFYMMLMGQVPIPLHRWLPSQWSSLGRGIARFYALFVCWQTSHLALLYTKTTFDKFTEGQLDEITDSLTMVIIYSFSAFATMYWMSKSRQLVAFMDRINREYRHHSLAGLTFVTSFRSFDWARKMTLIWITSCYTGVVTWGLAPIILGSRTLPLKCWYPFDPLQPGVYELTYTLQLLAQVNIGTTFGITCALFVSLCVIMLGQFDVLYCSLKNFELHARLHSGEDKQELLEIQKKLFVGQVDELNQYLFAEEHRTDLAALGKIPKCGDHKQRLHESLVECIKHHRFILDCCEELESLYNPFCLIKSLQITLQLCLLVFIGVAGERSTVRTINLLQYLSLTAVELMMFTYCGELLRSHSVRGGDALWRSKWWSHARHIRQDILIFLLNSRRSVKITAGKFYAMDVERLRSVVTQAFSFLTLLQKLADKNG